MQKIKQVIKEQLPPFSKTMSSIPKTMKAAVADKVGSTLVVKEVPVPTAEKGQVLIKVHTCGVCHSDSAAIAGQMGPG